MTWGAESAEREPEIDLAGRPLAGSVVADVTDEAAAPAKSTGYWVGVLLLLVLLSEEVAYAFNLVTPALPEMAVAFGTAADRLDLDVVHPLRRDHGAADRQAR